jgi:phosphopantetheine--protein transferase-like protein
MLESLLPPGVYAVEGPILTSDWNATPEELARAAAHTPHRKAEFLTGRTYARRALRALGIEAGTIGSHADRSPIWPEGTVGCISHTRDYCGVVVAKASPQPGGYRSLGLDIESVGRISEAVAVKTFTEAERSFLATVPEALRQERMCAIFCAKEAFYKLQFPITKAWVGFQDVEVRLEGEGRFVVRLEREVGVGFPMGRSSTGLYRTGTGILTAFLFL